MNQPMPSSQIQEQLSLAYVRSVIFDAGCNVSFPAVDRGIDGTIEAPRRGMNKVDFQIKSTTRQLELSDGNILYDLRVENYNQLIVSDDAPRVLILYLMPNEREEWISQSEGELCLRKCAYWASLMGRLPSRNKHTERVGVPLANIFSSDGLSDMFSQLL